jgi:hypothetical protein
MFILFLILTIVGFLPWSLIQPGAMSFGSFVQNYAVEGKIDETIKCNDENSDDSKYYEIYFIQDVTYTQNDEEKKLSGADLAKANEEGDCSGSKKCDTGFLSGYLPYGAEDSVV